MHFVTMHPSRGERIGDPTELALLDMAAGFEIQRERLRRKFSENQEIDI